MSDALRELEREQALQQLLELQRCGLLRVLRQRAGVLLLAELCVDAERIDGGLRVGPELARYLLELARKPHAAPLNRRARRALRAKGHR